MKYVSLITTVLNEEKTIRDFLESILHQTFLPDEIIIVDGGSEDKTFEILKDYEKKYPGLIRVFRLKNANIAKGRNFAIEKAEGLIIVTTDAGCIYDKNYVKEIIKPLLKRILEYPTIFKLDRDKVLEYLKEKRIELEEIEKEKSAEFVQGIYLPYYQSNFEYFAGLLLVKEPEKQYKIPTRMSARATAYFKYVWKIVKGYPEKYVTGEDTKFNLEILKKFKVLMKDKAICYWRMPRNIVEFYKKFEKYAIGDVIQRNILKDKKLLFFFIGFWGYVIITLISLILSKMLFIVMITLLLTYLLIKGFSIFIKTKKPGALLYIPVLEFTRRVAYQIGFIKGFIKIIKLNNN